MNERRDAHPAGREGGQRAARTLAGAWARNLWGMPRSCPKTRPEPNTFGVYLCRRPNILASMTLPAVALLLLLLGAAHAVVIRSLHTSTQQKMAVAVAATASGGLVSGGSDKKARLWSVDGSPATRISLSESVSYYGHGDWATGVAALPDGRIVTGSADGIVRVFPFARNGTAKPSEKLEGHKGRVWAVATGLGPAHQVCGPLAEACDSTWREPIILSASLLWRPSNALFTALLSLCPPPLLLPPIHRVLRHRPRQ